MSNKRQTEISLKIRSEFCSFERVAMSNRHCDLSILRRAFICGLLLIASSIMNVVEANVEIEKKNTPNNHKFDSNIQFNSKSAEIINDLTTQPTTSSHENEQNENSMENPLFYRSELHRLPYETINRILRDERDPVFRGENIDVRYYHTRSLQPTHEVVRRSAEENFEQNLNLHARNLSEFIARVNSTKELEAILTIDLSENLLNTIELSDLKNLISVNLSKNFLTQIPIERNSTFEILNLNSNFIQKGQLPQNEHLRELYLSNNSIENLRELNLSLLDGLETLDLSCNQIKNLETSFFPRLMHNLKYLNLAYNRLGSISRETFYNLLSLNTLLLGHNKLTFIDYETFLSLPNLQYLDLSHNQLRGESIRALQGIPDLVGLSIAYNPDMGESLQEFVASWSLKEVDASGTGLCQIPAALAQAVRTLRLADNWFKIINCGDLDSYPLLQHLDLSNSRIEDIEDDALGRLEFLEILFLDHNQLRKVPFSLPTTLEHLFLQYNEIMDLQVQSFSSLRNLKTLDLSHNKLLYLPALPLPKLLTLNLQASGLQGLNQAIVHSLPHLRDLLLEENPIKCSDLLGIAEWSSPCRIAERNGNIGKAMYSEQIGNLDVGQQQQQDQQQQQQQQTVATIDLKQNFVKTHNFYEKFSNIDGSCCSKNSIGKQILATANTATATATTNIDEKPPSCAVELNAQVAQMTNLMEEAMTTTSVVVVIVGGEKVEQPKLSPTQFEATTTTTMPTTTTTNDFNVHSNENRKVNEHSFEHVHSNATKMEEMLSTSQILENATFINPTENAVLKTNKPTESTMQISVNQKTTTPSTPIETTTPTTTTTTVHTQKYKIKNYVDAAAATTTMSTQSLNVDTDMPNPTISSIKSKQTILPTMPVLVPTTLITPTSDIKYRSEGMTRIATATDFNNNFMPQRMPTKIPTTMLPMAVSIYDKQNRNTPESLLERQRRVEMEHTTFTPTEIEIERELETSSTMHKTLPIILMTEVPNKSPTQYNGNMEHHDDNNNRKSLKIVNSEVSSHDELLSTTATTIFDQHKHASLQFHIKDRHLIGTPLLTHLGQNLLVAATELQSNPKHPTLKTPTATTTTSTTTKTLKKNFDNVQMIQARKNVENFGIKRNVEQPIRANVVSEKETTTKLTTTHTPFKMSKKSNNSFKKKPSLTMKKMTITTKHTNSTIQPTAKRMQENTFVHHQSHHHYTLNTPRENEVTPIVKSQNEFSHTSTNRQMNFESAFKHQFHHSNNKHSTVNTPIINGHEHELETFHEHNELEETAAAAAHASTSAIVGKITKLGSTTTSTSAKWFDLRKSTDNSAHPGIVILLSFGLFVVLLIGLLHVYRCDIPWPLRRRQRHQQRPYRIQQQQLQHQQQQQQHHLNNQTNFNIDDDVHSFLSYQSNSSNQSNIERTWRLETIQKQQSTTLQQHHQHQHQHQQQSLSLSQSPLQNLQVRELQQTSAIETATFKTKQPYKINSALGERSSSQTSSTCSPHSSDIFDDETFYIEMTTNMGQTINGESTGTLSHSDLLPMELLNISKEVSGKSKEFEISNQTSNSREFQTSSLDENVGKLQSNSKVTPKTRKLGIW